MFHCYYKNVVDFFEDLCPVYVAKFAQLLKLGIFSFLLSRSYKKCAFTPSTTKRSYVLASHASDFMFLFWYQNRQENVTLVIWIRISFQVVGEIASVFRH